MRCTLKRFKLRLSARFVCHASCLLKSLQQLCQLEQLRQSLPECGFTRCSAVATRENGPTTTRKSPKFMNRDVGNDRFGDFAQVLVMREVDHLAHPRHLAKQPEYLL